MLQPPFDCTPLKLGVDYRKYSFVPFGGAGPVHAMRIARKLGISKVIVPPRAGVLSAEGLLVSPLSIDLALTRRAELSDLSFDNYAEAFSELIQKGRALLSSTGITKKTIRVTRVLDMCYHGQGYDVPISLRGDEPSKKEFENLADLFEKAYRDKYSVAGFSKSIDVTAYKVTTSANALKISNKIERSEASRKREFHKAGF